METPTTPKFVRWAVLIGIVALLNAFAFIGLALLFEAPQYQDFYSFERDACYGPEQPCAGLQSPKESPECVTCQQAQQEKQQEAQMQFDEARQAHAAQSFLTLTAFAFLAIIVGIFLKGSSIVAAGLSYGGVVILIIAAIRHLSELDQLLQLGAVGAALVALLIIAYRRFKD